MDLDWRQIAEYQTEFHRRPACRRVSGLPYAQLLALRFPRGALQIARFF
jgi:hypothetical protein